MRVYAKMPEKIGQYTGSPDPLGLPAPRSDASTVFEILAVVITLFMMVGIAVICKFAFKEVDARNGPP